MQQTFLAYLGSHRHFHNYILGDSPIELSQTFFFTLQSNSCLLGCVSSAQHLKTVILLSVVCRFSFNHLLESNLLSDFVRELTHSMQIRVINLGSDTFGNPIFQKGLQNQPSSPIISILGCFAQLCHLVKNWAQFQ